MGSLSRDILCLGICSDFIFPQLGNMSLRFNRKHIDSIKDIHIKLDGWLCVFSKVHFPKPQNKKKRNETQKQSRMCFFQSRLSVQCSGGGGWRPETKASAPGVQKLTSGLHLFLPGLFPRGIFATSFPSSTQQPGRSLLNENSSCCVSS